MKKIFTLLLCTVFVSAAFAQYDNRDWDRPDNYGHHDHDRNYYHDYSYNNTFIYNGIRYWINQRDDVVRQINANYDYQIQRVANDWDMSPWRKRKIIDQLQDQKTSDINSIYAQCNVVVYQDHYGRRHHNDDHDR